MQEGAEISAAQRDWLAAIAGRYGAPADNLEELLRRVDVVPPSLALAQAALESGWGTSRGAQTAGALFGEMRRSGGLRRFDSPAHSVASYVANLNTHFAYRGFREARAAARQDGRPLDSQLLAAQLLRYSVLGSTYVHHVQAMIRAQDLQAFDDLLDGLPRVTVAEVPKPATDEPPL
jgi:Bax protein